MRKPSLLLLSWTGALALACGTPSDSPDVSNLQDRVAALERKLDARGTPGSPQPAPPTDGDAAVVRLDADLRSLERRLADVESDVALFRDVMAEGTLGDEAAGTARRALRAERRERMRDLTAEYRQRLADVRRQYQDDPANPERQRALRDVVDWYRDERRAIMRGG